MTSELRLQLAALGHGAHLCTVHRTVAEQMAIVVPFIQAGLAGAERCIFVGTEGTAGEVAEALSDAGVDVSRELGRGALRFATDRDLTRLHSGAFDPGRMVDFLRRTEAGSSAGGFSGLRVAGEMSWAMGLEVPPGRLIEFETLLDRFLRGSRSVVICQYDRSRFDPAVIHEVLRTHPVAVIGDQVCPNPYYEPADLLLPEQPRRRSGSMARRVEWRIEQLERMREAERGQLRLQVDRLPLAYIHMDPDARVIEWNRAAEELFGYSKAEASGRSILDLIVPPALTDRVREVIGRILAGDMHAHSINANRTKDSRIITCEWFNTPLRDAAGGAAGFVSLAQDVTERVRTEEALRESTGRLRGLSRRLVEVQEEERRRLARELHDEIGQALSAIGINLEVLRRSCGLDAGPRLDDCLGVLRQAIEQVRGLALDLRPSVLDDLGLVAALGWLVARQAERAGFFGHFHAPSSMDPLNPDLDTACFRVVQEALTNAVRHSRARNVWVRLRRDEGEVELTVRDDGVGFDPQEARSRASRGAGLGLQGIRERAEMLGGRASIESEPGHGASIRVRFPIAPKPPAMESGTSSGG